MQADSNGLTQARDVACTLVGAPVEIERLLTGGRNSRIYHVRSGAKEFALKQYPSRADDPRDRLSTEVGALTLMQRYHIDTVPRVAGVDRERGFALLSWIDGTSVTAISGTDVEAAAHFLSAIHALRTTPWAKEQPSAAEACFSGVEIERQITARLARLQGLSGEGDLARFLNDTFVPALEREIVRAKAATKAAGLDFAADLPQEWRSLVPSDFGFHNSLRRRDGSLAFVDFEYFGWDDPVKLSADIMLHPGKPLAPAQGRHFRRLAVELYGADLSFATRLGAYLPLFGLRWVLILLNEFIPERWQRRVLAGTRQSWAEARAAQLALASEFLAALPARVKDA
ncbi:MAG TPA: phosphotransferase [Pseudolabrys sp.]|nr:phosphotransferase [Pseudolabrys sp.]